MANTVHQVIDVTYGQPLTLIAATTENHLDANEMDETLTELEVVDNPISTTQNSGIIDVEPKKEETASSTKITTQETPIVENPNSKQEDILLPNESSEKFTTEATREEDDKKPETQSFDENDSMFNVNNLETTAPTISAESQTKMEMPDTVTEISKEILDDDTDIGTDIFTESISSSDVHEFDKEDDFKKDSDLGVFQDNDEKQLCSRFH